MMTEMDIFGGGKGGYTTIISPYASDTKISCDFKFNTCMTVGRRTADGYTWAIYYTKDTPTSQTVIAGNGISTFTIAQAGINSIITEVGDDYIKINGNFSEIYAVFA